VPDWRPDFDPTHLYFVTTAVAEHHHLFKRDVMKRLIADTLDCMRLRERFRLYGFVIMPNHLHMIMQCHADTPLAACVRDLKKHITDRLIRQYRAEGNQAMLGTLASVVPHPNKQRYKVWEDGYNGKDIFSPEFLRQKLAYIHSNPCQPHWSLAELPEEYIWSSARFYLLDEPAIIPLDNAKHFLY
jgi:REP element-mobilizing transposase RayT